MSKNSFFDRLQIFTKPQMAQKSDNMAVVLISIHKKKCEISHSF